MKLWPEDPLGPPLTRAELNRSIRTPALRVKLGLTPVPPKPDRNLDQQVRCQECRTVMQLRDVPYHQPCGMMASA